jgi:hypothetical protein
VARFFQILFLAVLKGMLVYTCNPTTLEAEAEGAQVQGQPGLHNEILSHTYKQKTPIIFVAMLMTLSIIQVIA